MRQVNPFLKIDLQLPRLGIIHLYPAFLSVTPVVSDSHILDGDRKINAQKFETAFYSNPDLRAVKPPESPESVLELDHLIEQLRRSPGLKKAVSQLIAAREFN